MAVFDLEMSLPILRGQLPAEADIRIVEGVADWDDLRATLNAEGWDDVQTIIIDSATQAEELAAGWVLKHIPNDKGCHVDRLEEYGYGKQFGYMYDTFLTLLSDLDRHVRQGRNVILTAHDCTMQVPNPAGPDWLRYEPRLQSPPSGKNSTRLRVREWADHVLFLTFDIEVQKDGKAHGSGTRTLYPVEQPWFMAKSRSAETAIPVQKNDRTVWAQIIS